jgi:hypothetical protein
VGLSAEGGPYSYDLLDNLGWRSPRILTPGIENLSVGQRWMVSASSSSSLAGTLPAWCCQGRVASSGLWRAATLSGLVQPLRTGWSCGSTSPTGGLGRVGSAGLFWGHLVMMRKQLLTIKPLAERRTVGDVGR